ncbi:DUF4012 domain-containing protein [Nocardioides sp. cx-169]|uniref:DUF4012 domain-containing protein n=1 Tax=Nocardioides sp. cx-169 TaxID=2899080 RepID=UPI001E352C98|nr:DUF4012 domain-containing protein [Nocardioides sp. cx-169]MCD4533152.1 DUF4012 domain-containing protein [Nocardioides sp. cx-169]
MATEVTPTTPAETEQPSRWSRRRQVKWIGGGLLALLFVLALPLLLVQHFANEARGELEAAQDAIRSSDFAAAQDHVDAARRDVTFARIATDGPSGLVWGHMPVAGGTVQDVGHLVSALDDATAVAETGVELYPLVAGDDATLFNNGTVDLATLDKVVAGLQEGGGRLEEATASLEQVEGDLPGIGPKVRDARDAAQAQLEPLASGYAEAEPLVSRLPAMLGAEGDKNYLIALLNPSELRYSGGAALSLAPMSVTDGTLEIKDSIDLDSYEGINDPLPWRKVPSNKFPGISFKSSTLAPSWNVSGEELLRSWQRLSGDRYDGVIAVDAIALARLFALTGPLEVKGYPTLTGDNLVQTLVGSYDLYPDAEQRDVLNAAVIKAFRGKLLDGGKFGDKLSIVRAAADGRHLALYVRDKEANRGLSGFGLGGNLSSPTSGDYLGVFTQNFNASKVDFWQQRTVTSDVQLDAEGNAQVRLRVVVKNASPPYQQPGSDPGTGYFTRDLGVRVATFLPPQATDLTTTWQGETAPAQLGRFKRHRYFLAETTLGRGEQAVLEATYTIPDAASVSADGSLTYQLTLDPQAMVTPQSSDVTVHWPAGFTMTTLAEGWSPVSGGAHISIPALDSTPTWTLEASPPA